MMQRRLYEHGVLQAESLSMTWFRELPRVDNLMAVVVQEEQIHKMNDCNVAMVFAPNMIQMLSTGYLAVLEPKLQTKFNCQLWGYHRGGNQKKKIFIGLGASRSSRRGECQGSVWALGLGQVEYYMVWRVCYKRGTSTARAGGTIFREYTFIFITVLLPPPRSSICSSRTLILPCSIALLLHIDRSLL
jgi:hypothetical protein